MDEGEASRVGVWRQKEKGDILVASLFSKK